jgi:ribosomal-protein-alanine N-acetyltransferase
METERLRLRNWQPSDREPFAKINADPRVMQFFPKSLTREESDAMVDRIEAHFLSKGFGLYAAELRADGRFIGYVGLHTPTFEAPFTPCVEIGWRLASNVWWKGLATEGATAVARHSLENLGLEQIVSFTVPANQRSIRVMEKIGMTRDASGDFEHPNLPIGHPLRHHVLYRLRNFDKMRDR